MATPRRIARKVGERVVFACGMLITSRLLDERAHYGKGAEMLAIARAESVYFQRCG